MLLNVRSLTIYPFSINLTRHLAFVGAKRIGLLFSEAKLDWDLDPRLTKDIGDIVVDGEVFSDGCGLISRRFAVALSKRRRIIFHNRPYTPSVYQIR